MSKKTGAIGVVVAFEYNCSCGQHFVKVGEAVTHVNKFSGHQLSRMAIEK